VLILLSLSSCREDIINPQNTGGNVNEPVLESTNSSYLFALNGENISYTVVIPTNISSVNNNLYFTLYGYNSGGVFISLYNSSGEDIFDYSLNNNEDGYFVTIFSQDIDKIKFSFTNFTGKFKFEIAPSY
jgi:hypothetical protein